MAKQLVAPSAWHGTPLAHPGMQQEVTAVAGGRLERRTGEGQRKGLTSWRSSAGQNLSPFGSLHLRSSSGEPPLALPVLISLGILQPQHLLSLGSNGATAVEWPQAHTGAELVPTSAHMWPGAEGPSVQPGLPDLTLQGDTPQVSCGQCT